MNAKHETAAAARDERILELRVDIVRELGQILTNTVHLERLAGTRQSVGLGFLTAEARELLDRQHREDRAAALFNPDRDINGTDWMNALSNMGTGQVPAPVTIAAVSMSAEILFTLQHHVRRLARPAARAAAAAVPGGRGRLPAQLPTTDGDTVTHVKHLVDLVEAWTNRPGLEDLLRELEHLNRKALDVVDGPSKTNHPDPCPWCDRRTLVVHHAGRESGRDTAFIRCEGEHRCECDWEFCDCHRNPIRNRHEWVNSGRAAHTWHELNNLLATRRETAAMETRALDALARAIDLHQPIWTHDDGTEENLWVHLRADQTPADHECAPGHPLTSMADVEEISESDDPTHPPYCYVSDDTTWHAVPICASCGDAGRSGDPDNAELWPCPTHQALDPDAETH